MGKILLVIAAIIFNSYSLFSIELSRSAEIYLITESPGKELYRQFGHSALRVVDRDKDVDYLFNYGTFDFNTENFYLKFLEGKTDYILSVSRGVERRVLISERDGLGITQNRLNLTYEQKSSLWKNLVVNSAKGNRVYRYSFLYDNCATRIRDIVEKSVAPAKIRWSSNDINYSYRDILNQYLPENSWSGFGIYVVLGSECDDICNFYMSMFIPDYLKLNFKQAKLIGVDGDEINLVEGQQILVKEKPIKSGFSLFSPYSVIVILSVGLMLLTWIGFRRKNECRWINNTLYFIIGFAGLIPAFLALISTHPGVSNNWNLLWISPLYLILWGFNIAKKYRTVHKLQILTIILSSIFATIFYSGVITQTFHPYTIIITTVIIMRSIFSIYISRVRHL